MVFIICEKFFGSIPFSFLKHHNGGFCFFFTFKLTLTDEQFNFLCSISLVAASVVNKIIEMLSQS